MGNCVGVGANKKKKKKHESREPSPVQLEGLPRVNQWLAMSDFSSIPDLEHFGEEPVVIAVEQQVPSCSEAKVIPVQDGYLTAPEELSEEEEPKIEPEASADKISRASSEYLTTDENEAEKVRTADISDYSDWRTMVLKTLENTEDDDTPLLENRDDRPVCSLPTPLRKNLFSPSLVEALADNKGRVKRKRLARFLELREEALPANLPLLSNS